MTNQDANDVEHGLLNVEGVAKRLKISTRTVYSLLKKGDLPATKVGKKWYVTPEALDQRLRVGLSDEPRHQGLVRPSSSLRMDRLEEAIGTMEENLAYIKGTLATASSLVSAASHGVEAIYPPRRASAETNEAIENLILAANGEILLCGIALRQFFHDRPFRKALWERLRGNPPVRVRALLIDPLSQAAKARIYVEEPFHGKADDYESPERLRKSVLFQDIERSIETIVRFQKELGPDKIEARFYDHNPFAFFIITNSMIIEQYHFGREDSPVGGCIGELVPLFRLSAQSDFYKVMKTSFNHIWSDENHFVTTKKLNQVLDEIASLEASSLRSNLKKKRVTRKKLSGARRV